MVTRTTPTLRRRRRVLGSLLALLSVSGLAGCADDQDLLIVERAAWFNGADDCTIPVSGDPLLLMTVDVSFDTRIGMGFVLTNNLSPNPRSNTGIDDSEIQLESAEVSFTYSGGTAPGSFEVSLPSNSLGGGDSQAMLIQVPSEVAVGLREGLAPGQFETLEMTVVFKARNGGQAGSSKLGDIESRAFTFPFEICSGCLANCNECGTCPEPTAFVGACGFAQGEPVHHPSCDLEP